MCSDFDLVWAIQAHNKAGPGISLDQPPLPPLALAMGSSALQRTELHLSHPRSLLCLWLTDQVSTSSQGSSNSPSKPRICSGFVNILFCVTTIIGCRTWTCLCRVNGKAARVTLPPVPCFVASCGSLPLHRSGCGSAVHLRGVTNRLPFPQHSPFASNF